jgi:hypothetical protein
MTEQQFLAVHNGSPSINIAYRINVNYDDSTPLVPGYIRSLEAGRVPLTIPNYITGITVKRRANSVDGVQGVDMSRILDRLERVRFVFNGYDVSLNILTRYYNSTGLYFYFRVSPFQLSTDFTNSLTDDPENNLDVTIDFTPFVEDLEYLFTTYNATYNNIQNIRSSYKIMECDRQIDSALPTNFDAIYDGTAQYAKVQDSLYSDTGWKNARYDGSKTNQTNFAGISPSISGRSFQGSVFSADTVYDTFCLIGTNNELVEELFHTGPRTYPQYLTAPLGIYLETGLAAGETVVEYISGSSITGSIEPGDILILQNEKLKIRSINTKTTPPFLTVYRGWGNSADVFHGSTTEFQKIGRVDIVRFNKSRSKSNSQPSSIIYIKDTNTAFFTDNGGTVYSQSVCPQTLLLGIDDPNPIP